MPLTDAVIRATRPRDRAFKLYDEKGLFLLVVPEGGRRWRLKYRVGGREKLLALGTYPEVSLSQARQRRDEARGLVADGVDPSATRRVERDRARLAGDTTFERVALQWLDGQRHRLSDSTFQKHEWMLRDLLLPWLGSRPIAEIEAPELLATLRRTESRGKYESTHRAKQLAGRVFSYAIEHGLATRNPAADLGRDALRAAKVTHRAAITDPARVADLLRKIHGYSGQPATCAALKLAPLLFVRPGELRAAEWREFDLDSEHPEWRVPAARTKMRAEHLVPLPAQAVAILRDLQPLTGHGRYVFPSVRTGARPLSENTINAALRSLGFDKHTMTGHGFRAMASTRLNEMGWAPDVIERQLAHAERNKVRAAYNRAQHIGQRRKMMQAWADYLDGIRAGGNVVPLRRAK